MLDTIIQSLVTGIAVGIVLFMWQRMVMRKDRCLANALAARQMQNAVMVSGEREEENYIAALLNVFDFVAIAYKKKELEYEEYDLWLRVLKVLVEREEYQKFIKTETERGTFSKAFCQMVEDSKKLQSNKSI